MGNTLVSVLGEMPPWLGGIFALITVAVGFAVICVYKKLSTKIDEASDAVIDTKASIMAQRENCTKEFLNHKDLALFDERFTRDKELLHNLTNQLSQTNKTLVEVVGQVRYIAGWIKTNGKEHKN